ncbi:hypothetical protein GF342_04640 [Candidatus Woesearchaeota archaeon]|nr:hypothetical protein [Candidatus Woesearchaeota archaeon]
MSTAQQNSEIIQWFSEQLGQVYTPQREQETIEAFRDRVGTLLTSAPGGFSSGPQGALRQLDIAQVKTALVNGFYNMLEANSITLNILGFLMATRETLEKKFSIPQVVETHPLHEQLKEQLLTTKDCLETFTQEAGSANDGEKKRLFHKHLTSGEQFGKVMANTVYVTAQESMQEQPDAKTALQDFLVALTKELSTIYATLFKEALDT